MKPENCENCLEKGILDGHHEDYSRMLDVVWLCVKCNRMLKGKKGMLGEFKTYKWFPKENFKNRTHKNVDSGVLYKRLNIDRYRYQTFEDVCEEKELVKLKINRIEIESLNKKMFDLRIALDFLLCENNEIQKRLDEKYPTKVVDLYE